MKGVEYFFKIRNEVKNLYVLRIFFKLGGLFGVVVLLMVVYYEVGKYEFLFEFIFS